MRSFSEMHPAVQMVYFLAVTGISMFCMHPAVTALSLGGALLLYFLRNGLRDGRSHLYFLLLFVLLALLNPLTSHSGVTVLFVMNDNPITLESLIFGIFAASSMTAVLYWFRSFSQIMTRDRLLHVFGRLSPKLALVLSMALRFTALLSAQAKKIAQAQKALGLYKEDTLPDRVRGGLRIFSILLTWAIENGIITADSMEARGYGTGKRTHFVIFRMTGADWLVLSIVLVCTALTLAGMPALVHTFYPYFSVSISSAPAVCSLISYGILVLLPTIIDTEEAIRWHCFLSGM